MEPKVKDRSALGKKVKVQPNDPTTTTDIKADVDKNLEDAILNAALEGTLNTSLFESFSAAAQTRESSYELIDTMAMDSTIAAAIETYAEDVTQTNERGDIFWAESTDAATTTHVNWLLKKLGVDRDAFSWAYNIVKYGDIYVKLLRNSDLEDSKLFNSANNQKEKPLLKEDVNLVIAPKNDHYAHTLEMMRNPNEFFELVKYGKSMAYIQAPAYVQKDFTNNNEISYFTRYYMNKKDVNIYAPTEFVHGCLEGSTSRADEQLDIFLNDDDYNNKVNADTYTVRRGTSILTDLFKTWRELSLLENSVLLNRITKSSIIRAIQVEVGDMSTTQTQNVLARTKQLFEQKTAINTNKNASEYTNPGPLENTVYFPTRNGKGTLSVQQIGGDVDPKQLTDLDWFNNKLFGGLKIPKQYFGFTDDAGGFSAGASLAQYSSRYGKAVKRIQKSLCQMVTDIINLILIDAGNRSMINNFTIRMQAPVTQEELDRKADLSNTLRNIGDIMNTISEIPTVSAKLKILKSLLGSCINDPEIMTVLEQEVQKVEASEAEGENVEDADQEKGLDSVGGGDLDFGGAPSEVFNPGNSFSEEAPEEEMPENEPLENAEAAEEPAAGETNNTLPSFSDLGIDGTVNP